MVLLTLLLLFILFLYVALWQSGTKERKILRTADFLFMFWSALYSAVCESTAADDDDRITSLTHSPIYTTHIHSHMHCTLWKSIILFLFWFLFWVSYNRFTFLGWFRWFYVVFVFINWFLPNYSPLLNFHTKSSKFSHFPKASNLEYSGDCQTNILAGWKGEGGKNSFMLFLGGTSKRDFVALRLLVNFH